VRAEAALRRAGHVGIAASTASRCVFLEGVSYPGLRLLAEALADPPADLTLVRDALGLDLRNISCVFLAPQVSEMIIGHGRLFLRNVRHGLYLLPDSVHGNYGIGCPVDPSFALGGERLKNPYAEKLEAAARDGVEVDEALWQSLDR
jgi:hypothetical protein